MKIHIVSIGGGISSTLMLPTLLLTKIPREQIECITCHLPNEDKDLFRLIDCVEEKLNISVKRLGHNKTPFQIFFESKFLGNSRIDPCSRILKREVVRDYILSNYLPNDVVLDIGIGYDELDRTLSIKKNWNELGYEVQFPLINYDFSRYDQMQFCKSFVGFIPRLYQMDFSHNNCGGACIKAGKKEWIRLLWFLPEVYLEWEYNENEFRKLYGDYTILTETRNGEKLSLTLTNLRERVEQFFPCNLSDRTLDNFNKIPFYKILKGKIDLETGCSFCDAMA